MYPEVYVNSGGLVVIWLVLLCFSEISICINVELGGMLHFLNRFAFYN